MCVRTVSDTSITPMTAEASYADNRRATPLTLRNGNGYPRSLSGPRVNSLTSVNASHLSRHTKSKGVAHRCMWHKRAGTCHLGPGSCPGMSFLYPIVAGVHVATQDTCHHAAVLQHQRVRSSGPRPRHLKQRHTGHCNNTALRRIISGRPRAVSVVGDLHVRLRHTERIKLNQPVIACSQRSV